MENKLNIESTFKLIDGHDMPVFGLGTYLSKDGDEVKNAVKYALDAGYKEIDTAFLYCNQASIGEALKEHKVDRKDIFIISKVWGNKDNINDKGTLYDFHNVEEAVDESLKRL